MFGKPEWFRMKKIGWGLVPATWQGWAYTALWASAIFLPCIGMLLWGLPFESVIWLVASVGLLTWDVRTLRRAIRSEEDAKLFYIGEDEKDSHVATRNYDLRMRE